MNISLTSALESFVKTKVEAGQYKTASEVIREGLRALQDKELDSRLVAGRKQAEAGESVAFDQALINKIINEVELRLRAK